MEKRNKKIFLVSDTHFGHRNIIKFENIARPFNSIEEHDEELVYRWNHVVSKNDTVWHLGDVLFGEESFELLKRLNGYKHLILGNHDKYPLEKYQQFFNKICSYNTLDGYLLSHIPIHPSQFYRYKGNIHGHMHSKVIASNSYVNVCVENWDLAPVPFEKIKQRFEILIHG